MFVSCSVSLLNGTQLVNRELEVIYIIIRTSIKTCWVISSIVILFILHAITPALAFEGEVFKPHTHAHTCTLAHAYIHTLVHAYIHTRKRTLAQCTHTRTHAHIHTHTHTQSSSFFLVSLQNVFGKSFHFKVCWTNSVRQSHNGLSVLVIYHEIRDKIKSSCSSVMCL